jgi:hypothetical protein
VLADLDLDSAVAVDGLHEVLIDQPVWASIQRLVASAAKTIVQVGSYGVALAVANRGLGDLPAIPRSVRRASRPCSGSSPERRQTSNGEARRCTTDGSLSAFRRTSPTAGLRAGHVSLGGIWRTCGTWFARGGGGA